MGLSVLLEDYHCTLIEVSLDPEYKQASWAVLHSAVCTSLFKLQQTINGDLFFFLFAIVGGERGQRVLEVRNHKTSHSYDQAKDSHCVFAAWFKAFNWYRDKWSQCNMRKIISCLTRTEIKIHVCEENNLYKVFSPVLSAWYDSFEHIWTQQSAQNIHTLSLYRKWSTVNR